MGLLVGSFPDGGEGLGHHVDEAGEEVVGGDVWVGVFGDAEGVGSVVVDVVGHPRGYWSAGGEGGASGFFVRV